jgi:hypothetical protein
MKFKFLALLTLPLLHLLLFFPYVSVYLISNKIYTWSFVFFFVLLKTLYHLRFFLSNEVLPGIHNRLCYIWKVLNTIHDSFYLYLIMNN